MSDNHVGGVPSFLLDDANERSSRRRKGVKNTTNEKEKTSFFKKSNLFPWLSNNEKEPLTELYNKNNSQRQPIDLSSSKEQSVQKNDYNDLIKDSLIQKNTHNIQHKNINENILGLLSSPKSQSIAYSPFSEVSSLKLASTNRCQTSQAPSSIAKPLQNTINKNNENEELDSNLSSPLSSIISLSSTDHSDIGEEVFQKSSQQPVAFQETQNFATRKASSNQEKLEQITNRTPSIRKEEFTQPQLHHQQQQGTVSLLEKETSASSIQRSQQSSVRTETSIPVKQLKQLNPSQVTIQNLRRESSIKREPQASVQTMQREPSLKNKDYCNLQPLQHPRQAIQAFTATIPMKSVTEELALSENQKLKEEGEIKNHEIDTLKVTILSLEQSNQELKTMKEDLSKKLVHEETEREINLKMKEEKLILLQQKLQDFQQQIKEEKQTFIQDKERYEFENQMAQQESLTNRSFLESQVAALKQQIKELSMGRQNDKMAWNADREAFEKRKTEWQIEQEQKSIQFEKERQELNIAQERCKLIEFKLRDQEKQMQEKEKVQTIHFSRLQSELQQQIQSSNAEKAQFMKEKTQLMEERMKLDSLQMSLQSESSELKKLKEQVDYKWRTCDQMLEMATKERQKGERMFDQIHELKSKLWNKATEIDEREKNLMMRYRQLVDDRFNQQQMTSSLPYPSSSVPLTQQGKVANSTAILASSTSTIVKDMKQEDHLNSSLRQRESLLAVAAEEGGKVRIPYALHRRFNHLVSSVRASGFNSRVVY